MKKESNIATAANSKTMNAIENTHLFAAAAETEPVISFHDRNKELSETNSTEEKNIRRNKKKRKG